MSSKNSQIIHFRQHLAPGSSDFDIPVSRAFCLDHSFSFPHLAVYPGMYSFQATRNDMDIEAELEVVTEETISVGAKDLAQIAAEHVFTNANNRTTPDTYIRDFNQFFHNHIPSQVVQQPFFFDWYDLNKTDISPKALEALVKKSFELYYQLKEGQYTASLENGLPQRLKQMPSANSMALPKFPLDLTLQDTIVLRLHMAPFSQLVCSTDKIFEVLGFNTEKIRDKVKGVHHTKFVLVNDSPEWRIIWGVHSPYANFVKVPAHTILFTHALDQVSSVEQWMAFTQRDFRSNKELLKRLKLHLEALSSEINIKFDLDYNEVTGEFKFVFPPRVNNAWVVLSPNLQFRLGQGYGTSVNRDTKSQSRSDTTDIANIEKKIKTLVMDTGIAICTRAGELTSITAGLPGNFMATLHPKAEGILETRSPLGYVPNRAYFDDLRYGSGNMADLKFRLYRYLDDGQMVPFEWKVDAYVLGELECTPLAA
jgi:hypothetical protein